MQQARNSAPPEGQLVPHTPCLANSISAGVVDARTVGVDGDVLRDVVAKFLDEVFIEMEDTSCNWM